MKKISTITFHAAHNYGSNLQAYALQEFIKSLCKKNNTSCDYEIINLHTRKQEELYSLFQPYNSLKNIIKNLMVFPYTKQLKIKQKRFNSFIKNELNITSKRYLSNNDLKRENFTSDYFISGSDQVWNIRSKDFDWANFLNFVNTSKSKKISYAASFGPLDINWDLYNKDKCRDLLYQYDYISVREEGSKKNIQNLLDKECLIHVDPTLLLTKEQWIKKLNLSSNNEKSYILFYSLEPNFETLEIVKKISKNLDLPVVITKYNNKFDYFNQFIKKYDCGPKEFLNLINGAKLIISSSFHGTVFSIIFNKPFFAINGLADNRISTLLKNLHLESREVRIDNIEEKCSLAYTIDFQNANLVIEEERKRSENYLKKALDINEV